jgi:hypothetical protein
MPNYILTTSSVILCPHGAPVTHMASNLGNYRVNGEPPMLLMDQYLVQGCPFISTGPGGAAPNPCIRVQWITGSNFLFVRGAPVLTNVSNGLCYSIRGIPAGPPIITAHQMIETEPTTFTRVD